MFRFLTMGIACVIAAGTALAAEEPAWEKALKFQLMQKEQCQLNYLTDLKTQELGSREVIIARAHCTDGRAFDIDNQKHPEKFEIHACGPTVC